MTQPKRVKDIQPVINACRSACALRGEPFHADALAAALGVSYETLVAMAEGRHTPATVAAVLTAALQECTAAVVAAALAADPKAHALWTFYLRNRAGFADKSDRRDTRTEACGVVFVGEERI